MGKQLHSMGVKAEVLTKFKRNALDLCLEKMEEELDDSENAARMDILNFFEGQKIEPSAQMRLWVYAKAGDIDQVQLCLNDGADVNLKNLQGKTAAGIAFENEHDEILELLKKHGAIHERASEKKRLKSK